MSVLPTYSPDKPLRLQRPEWLKVRANTTGEYEEVRAMMRRLSLVTVCEEARCPNIHECWARERTATFMLMGDICTRHCGFCAVGKGRPGALGPEEPARVAEAQEQLRVLEGQLAASEGLTGSVGDRLTVLRGRMPPSR